MSDANGRFHHAQRELFSVLGDFDKVLYKSGYRLGDEDPTLDTLTDLLKQVTRILEMTSYNARRSDALISEIHAQKNDIKSIDLVGVYGAPIVSVRPMSNPVETEGHVPQEAISVVAYLDTDDEITQRRILRDLDQLVDVMGFDGPNNVEVEKGSIFRRSWARIKHGLSSPEVTDRLVKIERAIELTKLDVRQAEVDAKSAQAVNQLLTSLADVPNACLRVGSILIIKYQSQAMGGPVILTRNLSQVEIKALERFPEIQRDPSRALEALAMAISDQDSRALFPGNDGQH